MKKLIGLAAISLSLFSCAAETGQYTLSQTGQQGAAVGGIIGATAGLMLDHSNRWRGGVIGGALGSALGGALGQMSSQK
ncbi:MAG: hypothetical protein C0170_00850 [Hydrogenobaculum sp.]|nr:MAG: hypothetical protein C0170_00850 [Hydrogenobaculum sp.]